MSDMQEKITKEIKKVGSSCTVCGNVNDINAKSCSKCGVSFGRTTTRKIIIAPAQKENYFEKYIICPNCETQNRYKGNFCGTCGLNLIHVKTPLMEKEKEEKVLKKETYIKEVEAFLEEIKNIFKEHIPSKEPQEKLETHIEKINFVIKHLKEELQEENKLNKERFSIINEIAGEVNQSLELGTILKDTLDRVLKITKFDTGVMMLVNEENKQLIPMIFQGVSSGLIEDIKKTTLKLDTGTHGRAFLMGRSVKAQNTLSSTSTLTDTLILKECLSSIISIPLKFEDKVVGIMSIGSRKTTAFSNEDMKLLDAIGNQIGIAIKNAQLYSIVKNQVKELEEKNQRLKELEAMKGNLIQMIVHDLKNPLVGIQVYLDLFLEEKDKYGKKQLIALNMMADSCNSLMKMITNLLAISKMEENALKLEKADISPLEIIKQVIREFTPMLKDNNMKVIREIEDVCPIKADRDILYRILSNLVSNAINHSPKDKNIKVGTHMSKEKDSLVFTIEDEGEGIPKEYLDKVFDKFFQVDRKHRTIRQSQGLGLTFCKLAAEAHGGKIWVTSEPGKGSKFYFSIPV
jgi:signal transduction histidine kinase/ribosomal protein L40E